MEQIANTEILNPNRTWVVSEFEKLYSQWQSWKQEVDAIVDQPYDRNTHSDVFADGKDMMLKHDVLQAKTLTFLNNNVRGHGFIRGFDGQHLDRTDLRLKIRVEHRMHDLEMLRETLIAGYARSGKEETARSATHSSPEESSNVVAKFKEHWLVSLFGVCAIVAAGTWGLAHQLLVGPRDFEISRLKEAAPAHANSNSAANRGTVPSESRILLSYVGVAVGDSITTPDGACTVRLVGLTGATAALEVAVEAEEPRLIEDVEIGRRAVVRGVNKTYYVDLHRARGNMVDLSVSSGPSAEQAAASDARNARLSGGVGLLGRGSVNVLDYLDQNKEWLFSGGGVVLIGFLGSLFWRRISKEKTKNSGTLVVVQIPDGTATEAVATKLLADSRPTHITRLASVTVADMTAALERAPPLQRDEVAKHYEGIAVQWDAQLFSAAKDGEDEVRLTLDFGPGDSNLVSCRVRLSEYRELGVLPKGAPISVIGKIQKVAPRIATLEDVQLFIHSDPVVPNKAIEPTRR